METDSATARFRPIVSHLCSADSEALMKRSRRIVELLAIVIPAILILIGSRHWRPDRTRLDPGAVTTYSDVAHDVSPPLASLRAPGSAGAATDRMEPSRGLSPSSPDNDSEPGQGGGRGPAAPTSMPVPARGAAVGQTSQGSRPPALLLDKFDGLGLGFTGPQGTANTRNPSDNSLAVGPNHIVEIVNSRMAICSKKGSMYDTTGTVLYGAVPTNTLFAGFGGRCEQVNNGDAVVRYDQLAGRWLYVMPIYSRPPGESKGPYSMCYAVSVGADPLGLYYRYEFKQPLFPDYPRPAIWIDGYYIPSSTGDDAIQKHACVAYRSKMLQGLPATEQCTIIDGVNFLNNADIDGHGLPPPGAPNIMMAAGGTQLQKKFEDDGIFVWKFHVDWDDPSKTKVDGPAKIEVAPYNYLCNGQLTSCVPQPGTDRGSTPRVTRSCSGSCTGISAIMNRLSHSMLMIRHGGRSLTPRSTSSMRTDPDLPFRERTIRRMASSKSGCATRLPGTRPTRSLPSLPPPR
jgi:hypothetical protein